MKKDLWCYQVAFCFIFPVCDINLLHRSWLMSNDILLQILKIRDFVEMFRYCEV